MNRPCYLFGFFTDCLDKLITGILLAAPLVIPVRPDGSGAMSDGNSRQPGCSSYPVHFRYPFLATAPRWCFCRVINEDLWRDRLRNDDAAGDTEPPRHNVQALRLVIAPQHLLRAGSDPPSPCRRLYRKNALVVGLSAAEPLLPMPSVARATLRALVAAAGDGVFASDVGGRVCIRNISVAEGKCVGKMESPATPTPCHSDVAAPQTLSAPTPGRCSAGCRGSRRRGSGRRQGRAGRRTGSGRARRHRRGTLSSNAAHVEHAVGAGASGRMLFVPVRPQSVPL